MSSMQPDALSGFPVTINTDEQTLDMADRGPQMNEDDAVGIKEFPKKNILYSYNREEKGRAMSSQKTVFIKLKNFKRKCQIPSTIFLLRRA